MSKTSRWLHAAPAFLKGALMIILKSPAEIEAMKEAGRLSAAVLREVGARCKPGVSTKELDVFAEEYIRAHGGIPTFKGYGGFPGSICASVNDQVIHGIPSKKTVLKEGDIISIDTGATVDGWAGDNAWTYPVGTVSADVQRFLEVSERSLWEAIEKACPGNHLGDIGHAVSAVAKANGYGIVREFVGHGIGHDMHEDPAVPNYGRRRSGVKLVPGMVLAIEPMITMGSRRIVQMPDGWLVRTKDGSYASHFEKTVAITKEGPLLISVEDDRVRPV